MSDRTDPAAGMHLPMASGRLLLPACTAAAGLRFDLAARLGLTDPAVLPYGFSPIRAEANERRHHANRDPK